MFEIRIQATFIMQFPMGLNVIFFFIVMSEPKLLVSKHLTGSSWWTSLCYYETSTSIWGAALTDGAISETSEKIQHHTSGNARTRDTFNSNAAFHVHLFFSFSTQVIRWNHWELRGSSFIYISKQQKKRHLLPDPCPIQSQFSHVTQD